MLYATGSHEWTAARFLTIHSRRGVADILESVCYFLCLSRKSKICEAYVRYASR